eukprot:558675-Amphidinium_carterae.1
MDDYKDKFKFSCWVFRSKCQMVVVAVKSLQVPGCFKCVSGLGKVCNGSCILACFVRFTWRSIAGALNGLSLAMAMF